jgi:CRP-like cAMP-binding protein
VPKQTRPSAEEERPDMEKIIKEIVRDLKDDTNLFHLFEESELEKIAPYFERAKFSAGATVFSEGDAGDFIAFVKSGRVEIKKETEFRGKQIVLAQMGKGSCLGELALFDQQPRSATVEAMEDTELLTLGRKAMDEFIEDFPALGIKVLKGLSMVLSMRLRQLADRLVVIF